MKHFGFKYQHPMAAYNYTPCGAQYEHLTTHNAEDVTCPKCKKWLKEAVIRKLRGKEDTPLGEIRESIAKTNLNLNK